MVIPDVKAVQLYEATHGTHVVNITITNITKMDVRGISRLRREESEEPVDAEIPEELQAAMEGNTVMITQANK